MSKLLSLKKVCFYYNKGKPILEDINLDLYAHEIICILGANGAGKSTLLKVIAGIAEFQGELHFKNNPVDNLNEYKRNIAYIPSNHLLYDILTGKENLELIRNLWDVPKKLFWGNVSFYSDKLGMNQHLDTRIEHYSEGMKDKLFFIGSISKQPDLLLLDEPFMSWDIQSQRMVIDLIKKYKEEYAKSIIIITHSEHLRETLADKTYLIQDTKLINHFSS
ncbi:MULTISPECIES: ABC transporter ATP-binding protein [Bacillus]|uniref:ATP-binding cassette domain-containing protein n=1 Tax=Bacillus TaxID=1386 RepID=UPI000BF8EBAA|nr:MULTISPECIES: ABC transporter ATP-binding protein [Bacillus]MCM3366667.1 ABC transporter ATP-binding protein [Bacillus safensis]MCY7479130.1 ABC transporter ATP-binding protein [Bacillus safensis]MCY7512649.1 ABC transporter ATP-binding protein [Bacillus safensis]MCY7541930.1 ABC transporter ATP-binding protein [Bacillus safensis]MCY7549718.1 ABC transporter ATP-binding protein [Bacillus safensis]